MGGAGFRFLSPGAAVALILLTSACGAVASHPSGQPTRAGSPAGAGSSKSPAGAASSTGAPSPAPTSVSIGVTSVTPGFAHVYLARDAGLFKKLGLNVTISPISPTAAVPALVSGKVDFFTSTSTVAEGAEKGLPVRVVMVASDHPNQFLIGAKGVTSVAQLRGQTVAGNIPGSEPNEVTVALLAANGLQPSDYRFLSGGNSDPVRFAMVQHGDAKAALLGLNVALHALDMGYSLLADADKFETLSSGLGTSVAEIQKHPDVVRRAIQASLQADRMLGSNQASDKAAVLRMLEHDFNFSAADAAKAQHILQPLWSLTGRPSQKAISTAFAAEVKALHLTATPQPSQIFDFSLLPSSGSGSA